jgi:alpha-D-ribose 1-methylphosphonate 5-triphosphate diphosphatase PhnM
LLFSEATIHHTASNNKVTPDDTVDFEDKGFSIGIGLLADLKKVQKVQKVPWIMDVILVSVRNATRSTRISVADGDASFR